MEGSVLFCASSASHINCFHLPYLAFFKNMGFEVHVCVPDADNVKFDCVAHSVSMAKSILSPKNLKGSAELFSLMSSRPFSLILTHTALASAVARLPLYLMGAKRPPVINTVHGYLFWDGCPPLNRLLYALPERLLAPVTDCIITMNEEDFITAKTFVKKGGAVIKSLGMGVDNHRFYPVSKEREQSLRQELSLPSNAFVMAYAAEFSKRKNHKELLLALGEVVLKEPSVLLLLCGTGGLLDDTRALIAKLGLEGNVRFLGYRSDMDKIYNACHLCVSSSLSEGLPFNIMESQLCGRASVASRIRGHIDLIDDPKTGFLYTPGRPDELADAILRAIKSPLLEEMGQQAAKRALQFSIEPAFSLNTTAYMDILGKYRHRKACE